jgi:hypothetical protein
MGHHLGVTAQEAERVSHTFTIDEFVALKAIAAKAKKTFWTDYPLLISLFAFLLSLLTSIASIYVGHQKDVHDQLAELSAAIRTLRDLNLKQIEIGEKYSGSPAEGKANALISNEIYNTTMMAAEIAFRTGTNATTATIIPISQNIYHYGQYSRATALAQVGLDAARTAEDEATALKWLGRIKIQDNTPQSIAEGDQLFLRALNFEQKYGQVKDPNIMRFIKAGVELDWATALARTNCDDARKHFSEARAILDAGGRNDDLERLRGAVRRNLTDGIGGSSSCPPVPVPVPDK